MGQKRQSPRAVISAGEINKYVYCPLQWYYERTIGQKAIRGMYRERFPEDRAIQQNFNRGQAFHKGYLGRGKAAVRFAVGLLVVMALFAAVLLLKYLGVL